MSENKGYVDVVYLKHSAILLHPSKEASFAIIHLQPGYGANDRSENRFH